MTEEFQYVIVGSGVAGSTIARQLLDHERSASILILEAGPKVQSRNRRYWWDYVVRANGHDHKPYDYTYDQPGESRSSGESEFLVSGSRVTAYGGSTLHWGGWSLRFKPEDFRLRENSKTGQDWPIEYCDLEPYYCRAEAYLSVCGDNSESWNQEMGFSYQYPRPPFYWTAADGEMIEAFEKLDIEPGKMPIARYRRCMTTGTCKYCPLDARFTGQIVLDELVQDKRHSNLEVRCNAPASEILMDSGKRRIAGVEYMDLATGEKKKVVGKTVILCAGAYEVPKLLMLSKSGRWENGIGNDNDLLGRYLVSHSILFVRGKLHHNKERWIQEYDFPTLMSRSFDTAEVQEKTNKIFLFKNRARPNLDIASLMIAGKGRKQIEAELEGSREQELQAFMEEKGKPENRLLPIPGKNRFGLPNMEVRFSRPPETTKAGEAWLGTMAKVIKTMGYKETLRKIRDPGGHHATGTCRMGKTPDEGVTDKNLRVFGTDNLFVCSNAVFPSGSAVNPTLTLVALAFRLGDYLNGKTVRDVAADTAR